MVLLALRIPNHYPHKAIIITGYYGSLDRCKTALTLCLDNEGKGGKRYERKVTLVYLGRKGKEKKEDEFSL